MITEQVCTRRSPTKQVRRTESSNDTVQGGAALGGPGSTSRREGRSLKSATTGHTDHTRPSTAHWFCGLRDSRHEGSVGCGPRPAVAAGPSSGHMVGRFFFWRGICEPARFLRAGLPVSVTCRNLPRSGCAPSVSTHAYIPEWLSSSVSEGRF